MLKKNLDIIGWILFTVMINFFPPSVLNYSGKYRMINVNSPMYEFSRYALPLMFLAVIIYRRWRNR